MRQGHLGILVLVAATLTAPAPAAAQLKAGVGSADATWHVGASAGQYASDGTPVDAANGNYDPTMLATRRAPSYGVQSRLEVRAIVIEGPGGNRIALLKNDQYIPQDLVMRRAVQLLEAKPQLRIGRSNLTMAVTHNHSSPMYSSTSWGVWAFQDVFDIRFYNYLAERMAAAVEEAASRLVPVRVGASVGYFDKTARHSFGPALGDDGSPAGYPVDDTDHDITVVRFDDISDPARPKPLANLVNFALHPEFLDGNDLISADYLGPLQAMTDRATGAMTIWTQGAVGTAEPERSTYHPIRERLEFTHREYAQAEYGARLMSDAIMDIWRDIELGTPERPASYVPLRSSFTAGEVAMKDRWFPGPITHPYPGVSNCRTDPALAGEPLIPAIGLPDCKQLVDGLNGVADEIGLDELPVEDPALIDPGLTTDDFQRLGIPVPENYAAPAYGSLEEDINVHLQAFRIGDILFTVCSCEQWADQSRNIRTRTDKLAGNEHLGYQWKPACTQNGDGTYGIGLEGYGTGTWTCPDPRNTAVNLPPLSDKVVQRMQRQVVNPADGWNDLTYAPFADSEPTNLNLIKGNYTQDDGASSAALGYQLTVPIGMGNDYNGYIATYREFQRGDSYRKALTGWGPHSSDYMATRMVNMGRVLNGGSELLLLPPEYGDPKIPADLALNDARAQALGATGTAVTAAYEVRLPDDGGQPEVVKQPGDIERFDGTFLTWVGGSNYTDDPRVKVQRKVGGDWRDYAGQSAEIPVTLEYPEGEDAASFETGSFVWRWTAHFEAFAARFETIEGVRATPAPQTYRFVVEGRRRSGKQVVPYKLESEEFVVSPWDGISVDDLKLDADGRVSFKLGPRSSRTLAGLTAEIGPIDYPDTYDYGSAGELPRFIDDQMRGLRDPEAPNDPQKIEWFCEACSFRPWIDFGNASAALVTIVKADGSSETVPAIEEGGRWRSARVLGPGESAGVGAGCVRDPFGNFNGQASGWVGASAPATAASCAAAEVAPPGGGLPGGGLPAGGVPGGGGEVGGGGSAGCPPATGSLRRARVGVARLDYRRARHRRLLPGLERPRGSVDRFCHADGGKTRIGYPTRRFRSLLARSERRRVLGRAVLILTSSRRYSIGGVRNGSRLAEVRDAFGSGLRSHRVGLNTWYLTRGSRSRLVFKVRDGVVGEVGVADLRLTRGRLARPFLRSFK